MGDHIETETLRVAVLGPVRAWHDQAEMALGPPQQRAVLARLAVQPGRLVPRDALVDGLWGGDPPASAVNSVHRYVAGLRTALEPGRDPRAEGRVLRTAPSGYLLDLDPGQIDVTRFARLLDEARDAHAAGDQDAAVRSFDEALALWTAPALSGIPGPFAEVERARLAEEYWTAVEDRADALLSHGRAVGISAELASQVREQPLRERLCGLLMQSLSRAGRRAEALAVFRDIRRTLAEELGIEPGAGLQELHRRILAGDDAPRADSGGGMRDPRLPAAPPVPAQLPHDLDGFTGRAAEVSGLLALRPRRGSSPGAILDPGPVRMSVIDGTAGVGKTALAVHVAHRLAAFFPDGQMFIDLRGFTPRATPMTVGEALDHLLRGLGADPRGYPASIDAQAAMYRTLLAGRRILIVLDNAESTTQLRPLLPGTGTCLVLITSRNRLDGLIARDGARRIALDVLAPSEATTLLARFCGPGQVAAEPGAAADLARLCSYLPLALRIVAERAATRPGETLASLAAELATAPGPAAEDHEGRLDLLAVTDDATSVRAAFFSSYHALPTDAARAFRMLGSYPGPAFTVLAAAAFLGIAPDRARVLLDELSRGHLIGQSARGRYRFHDLIRWFAAEQAAGLPCGQRDDAVRRLLSWYLHTADAADTILDPRRPRVRLGPPETGIWPLRFASYAEALCWCEEEQGNLLAITRHAADSGLCPSAWQLPVALFGYFYLRKPWITWLTATRLGLLAARRAKDPLGQATTLTSLGIAHAELRQSETAIDHLTEALPLMRALGHRGGEAIALVTLGAAHGALEQHEQAVCRLHEALVIWRQSGDRWGEAITLQYLGETHLRTRRLAQAVRALRKALRIRRGIGDRYGAAWTYHDLAAVYCRVGDFGTAVSHLRQAQVIRREIGDRWGEASSLSLLGEALSAAGRGDEARQAFGAAQAILTELGAPGLDVAELGLQQA